MARIPLFLLPFLVTLTTAIALPLPSNWPPKPQSRSNSWHYNDSGLAYPRQRGPDYGYTSFEQDQQLRADAVIEQFRFAWNGYYTYAFPHDDLLSQNNTWSDSRNGWGLLMFDALDTAIVMEQTDIVNIILDNVPTVDITKNNAQIQPPNGPPNPVSTRLFETNIRYLGGMLAAESNVNALLTQAQSLADTSKFAFETPSGIPVNSVYLDNRTFASGNLEVDGTYWANLAEFGTLCLEWQHLSDLTGDPSYGDLAQKAEANWFTATEIWPGLTGGNFSIQTGQVQYQYGGWTSGNDSAYEYLIKMYVYDPERYQNYSDRWQAAADSSIAHLISHPSSRSDLTTLGAFDGMLVENYTEQLACFIGGNFILGGTVLGRQNWNTSMLATANYTNQTSPYETAGWFIPDNTAYGNGQAPEAAESWYYAWQVTGDQYWRDVAWAYTLPQNQMERVGSGVSNVLDVLHPTGGANENFIASFMLAEVLKYQYLIQRPNEEVYDVEYGPGNKNYWVFNTEAHPFKVAAKDPV